MSVIIEEPSFTAAGLSLRPNGLLLRSEQICPYGHKKNNTCSCVGGQVPEDLGGCHGATFALHGADAVISCPLDQPEPGCEAT